MCARALLPMKQKCTKFLNSDTMTKATLKTINEVASTCPAPCDTFGAFSKGLNGLNAFCCTGPGESCQSGVPSKCDSDCSRVLLPFRDQCTASATSVL